MYTRREFGIVAVGGLIGSRAAVASASPSPQPSPKGRGSFEGVRLGVQTYSFRDLPRAVGSDAVESIIAAMTDCGLGECELWAPQLEPLTTPPGPARPAPGSPEAQQARSAIRAWRLETPLEHFGSIRKKFEAAGLSIYAYNYSFNTSFSDPEIDRGFEMAKALGAEIITASTTLDVAKRVAPFAEKHRMVVAMHNHSQVDDPNELATPESFAAAMRMSKYFKVNLDIGHFTAGNNDPLAYIREHHEQITNLHLKDRKKDQGDNVPWGQGDTPIRETLQLLERERWPIRAHIEYEYKGTESPVDEVKTCFAYAKHALTQVAQMRALGS